MHPFFSAKIWSKDLGGGVHIIPSKNKLLPHVDENFLGVQIIQRNSSFFSIFGGAYYTRDFT